MRGEIIVGRFEGLLGEGDHVLRAIKRSRILPAGKGGRRDGFLALNGFTPEEQVEFSVGGGVDGVFAAGVSHACNMVMRCADCEMRERSLIDSGGHPAD